MFLRPLKLNVLRFVCILKKISDRKYAIAKIVTETLWWQRVTDRKAAYDIKVND